MKDMQLIMENWRNFSKNVESKSKNIIVETRTGTFQLETLNENLSTGKISRDEYVKILAESIERDLKFLNEGFIEKAVGALKGVKDAIINKINEMGIKMLQLAIKGSGVVFGLMQKVLAFVERFKQSYPTLYSVIALVVKIAFWSAVAYFVYKHSIGTAKADVVYSDWGSKTTLTSDSQAMLNLLHNKAQMKALGFDVKPELVDYLDGLIREKGSVTDVTEVAKINKMLQAMHDHLMNDATLNNPDVLDRLGSLVDATKATSEQAAQYLADAAKFANREIAGAIHSKAELTAAAQKAGYTGEIDAQHLKDIVTALLKKKHVTGDPAQYKTAFFSLMSKLRPYVQ